ncbi:MAG: amidohydrolase family protein, partial [Candidatus Limnocylindrales bacterium]
MTRTVFSGGRIFDGTAALPTADVAVEAGRIVAVGPRLDGDQHVDVAGRTILPGLFDCHVHLAFEPADLDTMVSLQRPFSYRFYVAIGNMRATLDTGITTVRDAGYMDLGMKQAIEDGLVAGPRAQIAVNMISQTGGHGDGWMVSGYDIGQLAYPGLPSGMVDSEDGMRLRVRELVRAGADVIKVFTTGGVLSPRDDPRHAHFSDGELAVLVEEATRAHRFVMAHAQGAPGIKSAVRAGIRSIDHGIYLDDEGIALMLAHGTWLVPTLVAARGVVEAADAGANLLEAQVRKAREVVEVHRAAFRRAVAAGVKVAMGTDSGVTTHGQNLRELELMAEDGMPPVDVLLATTRSAAELMGLEDELGSLEPG